MKILDENGLLYLWQKIKAVIQKTTGIPTNGIIDYEGDTIPEGYEEVDEVDVIGSIISAGISTTYTIKTTNAREQLNLDTVIGKIGKGLTLQNGKIVVGTGIKYVKVSSQIFFENAQNSNTHQIRIGKNNSENIVSTYILTGNVYGGWNVTLTSAPIMIPVTEGDALLLFVVGAADDKVATSSTATFLTVEAVG